MRGDLAQTLKGRLDAKPFLSQFGWQFETRFLSTPDGVAGLSEWIPLVAGVGLVLAEGITARTATLNFPFNVGVSLYKKGISISLLIGFNAAG